MPLQNQTATLLIISTETSEAERLLAPLRAEGLNAKSFTIPHADHLQEAVTQRGCDLILCCSFDPDLELESVLASYRSIKVDVPLIVISDPEHSAGERIKARRGGARDLVLRHDNEHLKFVVDRELTDLQLRRTASGLTERIQQCEQRSRELVEVTSAGVALIQEGLHVDTNPAYGRLFGYAVPDDLLASPFLDLIGPADQKQVRDLLRAGDAGTAGETRMLEIQCQRADGTPFRAHLLATPAEFDDAPCLRVILHEVEPRQAVPAAAPAQASDGFAPWGSESALHDLLLAIDAHVDRDRKVTEPFGIFYIRVKQSQELLRQLGLVQALRAFDAFAASLAKNVGDRGLLVRISDDDFGLVVDAMTEYDAKALAEQLTRRSHLPPEARSKDDKTSDCEIGYFIVRDRAAEAEDIINAAHRLCIGHDFKDEDHVPGQQPPTSLAARIKQGDDSNESNDAIIARKVEFALHTDQLKLVYQPIISLMGDNQENYSVLLRLLDDKDNLLEAKDFIGPAIRSGLIEEIDKWTIRAAIQVIGEQRRNGHNLTLFVNLSEDTFRNPSIVLWICDCLREFDVRGNWLTFQFQEELLVGNLASISKLVDTLKKIKCRIAINRFGVSDRPEMLLQGLSLDFVLLKPSFAQGLAEDPGKQKRLIELANLAREFNVRSIVTGVEDARALTVLWTAGVDYVQGNFLQRPSPTIEVQS